MEGVGAAPTVDDLVLGSIDAMLAAGRADLAAGLAGGRAFDADVTSACAIGARAAQQDWHGAFAIACRHLAARHRHQARTRVAMARALRAAAGDPAVVAGLARLVSEGESGPLATSLYLMGCALGGHPIDLDLATPLGWEAAIFAVLDDCEPELLARMIHLVRSRLRPISMVGELAAVIRRVPARLPGDAHRHDPLAAVQLAPSPGPWVGCLLVCLPGVKGRIGLPRNAFHRWTARTGAHVLYLNDFVHEDFRDGVAEIGPTFGHLASFVRDLAAALGVRRVATFGSSAGGLAAVRLALEAGGCRAIVTAGMAGVREARRAEAAPDTEEALAPIRLLVRGADPPLEALWLYSQDHVTDAGDARAMATIPGIRLQPVPGGRHNVARHLVATDTLAPLLAWATAGDPLPFFPAVP